MTLGIELIVPAFILGVWLLQPRFPELPTREAPDCDPPLDPWLNGYRSVLMHVYGAGLVDERTALKRPLT